jgi:hypothetical protein
MFGFRSLDQKHVTIFELEKMKRKLVNGKDVRIEEN